MSGKLFIEQIDIENIGGLKEFSAKLGVVNLVTGANGEGKTSVLNAIETILAGGHDPDLIHQGEEKGSVTLLLSDGTTITKTITRDESNLVIKSKEGGRIKRPAEYLSTLASSYSFDPIGFIDGDPKKRAEFLLKNLDLQFSADEINAILGAPIVAPGVIALDRFNEIRDGRYQERTDITRKANALNGSLSTMKTALPKDEGTDWDAECDRLRDEIDGVAKHIHTAEAGIKDEAHEANLKKSAEIAQNIADFERRIAAERDELHAFQQDVLKEQARAITERTKELEATKAELSLQLGTAKSKLEQHQQAAGVRKAIDKQQGEYQGLIHAEMTLTEIIKNLDALKNTRLKELPIDGLDLKIEKGKPIITIHGIPLEKLNRQQAIYVGMQAVQVAAGRLPLILCEGAELDESHVAELSEAIRGAGLQLVMARWKEITLPDGTIVPAKLAVEVK